MTQDEIIAMAKQAGFDPHDMSSDFTCNLKDITAFANLVAKHTLMNIDPSKFMSHQEVMEAARLAEREACAKLVEESSLPDTYSQECLPDIANEIRDRGEQA